MEWLYSIYHFAPGWAYCNIVMLMLRLISMQRHSSRFEPLSQWVLKQKLCEWIFSGCFVAHADRISRISSMVKWVVQMCSVELSSIDPCRDIQSLHLSIRSSGQPLCSVQEPTPLLSPGQGHWMNNYISNHTGIICCTFKAYKAKSFSSKESLWCQVAF